MSNWSLSGCWDGSSTTQSGRAQRPAPTKNRNNAVGARNARTRAALGAAPTRTSQTIERERKSRKQGALFVRTENRLDRVGRQPNRRLHSPVTVRRMQGIPCADEPFPLGFGVQSVCDAGACAQSHPLKPRWRFAFFAATGKEGRRRSGETPRQTPI